MKLKDIIILIFVIFLGGLAIFWVTLQFSKFRPEIPIYEIPKAKEASLTLWPTEGKYQVGTFFSINLLLDNKNKKAAGIDIILYYNPTILEVVEIRKGSVFENFVLIEIKKEKGEIRVSALSPPGQGFIGQGEIATLDFKALQKGKTDLVFDFQKSSTAATNLAELGTGRNLLGEVINGSYEIYD